MRLEENWSFAENKLCVKMYNKECILAWILIIKQKLTLIEWFSKRKIQLKIIKGLVAIFPGKHNQLGLTVSEDRHTDSHHFVDF